MLIHAITSLIGAITNLIGAITTLIGAITSKISAITKTINVFRPCFVNTWGFVRYFDEERGGERRAGNAFCATLAPLTAKMLSPALRGFCEAN